MKLLSKIFERFRLYPPDIETHFERELLRSFLEHRDEWKFISSGYLVNDTRGISVLLPKRTMGNEGICIRFKSGDPSFVKIPLTTGLTRKIDAVLFPILLNEARERLEGKPWNPSEFEA